MSWGNKQNNSNKQNNGNKRNDSNQLKKLMNRQVYNKSLIFKDQLV